MPVPQVTAQSLGCPAGLEYLTQLDRLLVSRYREGKNPQLPTTIWPALEIKLLSLLCGCIHIHFLHCLTSTSGFMQPVRTYRIRNNQGQDVYYIDEGKRQ